MQQLLTHSKSIHLNKNTQADTSKKKNHAIGPLNTVQYVGWNVFFFDSLIPDTEYEK